MTGRGREGAHIANDVGVAEVDAKGAGGIDAGVHAGEDEVLLCRGQGEVALGEGGGVALRGGLDVALDGGLAHVGDALEKKENTVGGGGSLDVEGENIADLVLGVEYFKGKKTPELETGVTGR